MGLISRLIGVRAEVASLAEAATGIAEVFTPNATKRLKADQEAYLAALGQFGTEFRSDREGVFNRFVNGLNRLPRPMLALGTIGLFIAAMIDPASFTQRMEGLNHVPEPLWWLLGAIVSFYFGAREAHYFRAGTPFQAARTAPAVRPRQIDGNAALAEWQRREDR